MKTAYQTVNLTLLKVTVSTLKPRVGIVFTAFPNLSLYKIVDFPPASKPTIKIFASVLRAKFVKVLPILYKCGGLGRKLNGTAGTLTQLMSRKE